MPFFFDAVAQRAVIASLSFKYVDGDDPEFKCPANLANVLASLRFGLLERLESTPCLCEQTKQLTTHDAI
jgi:hypothetical protein